MFTGISQKPFSKILFIDPFSKPLTASTVFNENMTHGTKLDENAFNF